METQSRQEVINLRGLVENLEGVLKEEREKFEEQVREKEDMVDKEREEVKRLREELEKAKEWHEEKIGEIKDIPLIHIVILVAIGKYGQLLMINQHYLMIKKD